MARSEQVVRVHLPIVNSLGPASGVVFRPVVDLEPADIAVAWRSGDSRELVTDFVSAACDAFDRTPPLGAQSA